MRIQEMITHNRTSLFSSRSVRYRRTGARQNGIFILKVRGKGSLIVSGKPGTYDSIKNRHDVAGPSINDLLQWQWFYRGVTRLHQGIHIDRRRPSI